MVVLEASKRRRLNALVQLLGENALAGPDLLDHVNRETQAMLDAEVASCHRAVPVIGGLEFEFFHVRGGSRDLPRAFREALKQFGASYAVYDPTRPEPAHRNKVWRHRRSPQALASWKSATVVQQVYPKVGLAGLDEMRVLVCDGPILLAWLGGLRQRPFDVNDERVLGAIARPLGSWLRWRERLGARDADADALPVVLETISVAAFVLDRHGRIRHVNAAGRTRLERDRRGLRTELAHCAKTGASTAAFAVTAIKIATAQAHHVLCIERPALGIDARISSAAVTWRLTARETEVLRQLAVGLPNRQIASHLGCSERTVEIHVSRMLAKAGVESRTAMVWRMLAT